MLLMQLETVSVDELAVASVKATTMPAQPDTETLDEQHDRVCADMAGGVQHEYVVEHMDSIASDSTIASMLQSEEDDKEVPDHLVMPPVVVQGPNEIVNSFEFGHMSPLCKYKNYHSYAYSVGTKIRTTEAGGKIYWKCRIVDVETNAGDKSV